MGQSTGISPLTSRPLMLECTEVKLPFFGAGFSPNTFILTFHSQLRITEKLVIWSSENKMLPYKVGIMNRADMAFGEIGQ